jgi:hypothetical protein
MRLLALLTLLAAAARADVLPARCHLPLLMMRTEASPRSAAFTLGADAFDRATTDWNKRRFVEAARGFMNASAHFAAAGVEGNWKYSWQNAAAAFEASGKIDEGKAAFEAAAAKDAAHAAALRAAGAVLTSRTGCR